MLSIKSAYLDIKQGGVSRLKFSKITKIKYFKHHLIILFLVMMSVIFLYSQNKNKINTLNNLDNFLNNIYLKKTLDNVFLNLEPKYKQIKHTVSPGENLKNILLEYSISSNEIDKILNLLKKETNLKKLNANSQIEIVVDQSVNQIVEFKFPVSKSKHLVYKKSEKNDDFKKIITLANLTKKIIYEENIILDSLYKSASKRQVPVNIIIEFARIYGFEVDFQRDIKKRDSFQIMYEVFYDEKNNIAKTGNILFSNLNLNGQNNELYFFKNKNIEGHFNKSGRSIVKTLMKTPINGARLSSPFGMRKHPIDGFNKMHKGTDFAAPLGTPIMASGDGVITKVGWCGGGGNCVKIKHNSTYQTVYAHMSKFAKNIKKGVNVKQGMTIGFVGSTGKSTGPHLHYEVIVNGKKVNSQTLKLPSGKVLKKENRFEFETQRIKLDVLKSEKIMGLI